MPLLIKRKWGVATLILDKLYFRANTIIREKEGHYLMTRVSAR
jgi:hypothetical protein